MNCVVVVLLSFSFSLSVGVYVCVSSFFFLLRSINTAQSSTRPSLFNLVVDGGSSGFFGGGPDDARAEREAWVEDKVEEHHPIRVVGEKRLVIGRSHPLHLWQVHPRHRRKVVVLVVIPTIHRSTTTRHYFIAPISFIKEVWMTHPILKETRFALP